MAPGGTERRVADRSKPPLSEYMTRTEVSNMHFENLRRIEAMEARMAQLHDGIDEVLVLLRNTKLAAQVANRGFAMVGRLIVWLLKIGGVLVAGYATWAAFRDGKLPPLP